MGFLAAIAGVVLLLHGLEPVVSDFGGRVLFADRRPAKDAVIVLEGTVVAPAMADAVMDQRAKAFIPHVMVITKGTTVAFPNNDVVLHNVFAQFEAKKFDLGLYPQGATVKQTFEKEGIVAIRCNIHSRMSAYLYVTTSPYHAVSDKEGRFRIPQAKPGKYRLRVWHESGSVLESEVVVDGALAPRDWVLSHR